MIGEQSICEYNTFCTCWCHYCYHLFGLPDTKCVVPACECVSGPTCSCERDIFISRKVAPVSKFCTANLCGDEEMRSSMQSFAFIDFLSIERIKMYCANWSTLQASCRTWWCLASVSWRHYFSVLVSTVIVLMKFLMSPGCFQLNARVVPEITWQLSFWTSHSLFSIHPTIWRYIVRVAEGTIK